MENGEKHGAPESTADSGKDVSSEGRKTTETLAAGGKPHSFMVTMSRVLFGVQPEAAGAVLLDADGRPVTPESFAKLAPEWVSSCYNFIQFSL